MPLFASFSTLMVAASLEEHSDCLRLQAWALLRAIWVDLPGGLSHQQRVASFYSQF
jgi:hypothetical protein